MRIIINSRLWKLYYSQTGLYSQGKRYIKVVAPKAADSFKKKNNFKESLVTLKATYSFNKRDNIE